MAITRRQFLKRAGVAAAGTMIAPSIFGSSHVREAFADTIGDRYLVMFFLDGGNDGLNTILPMDDTANYRSYYEMFRADGFGGIRIDQSEMFIPSVVPTLDPATGTQLGFHPSLAPLGAMYDAGNFAVVQGCGYPDPSLSHDTSQTIWKSANPAGNGLLEGTGWAGRHLGLEYGPQDIYGVTMNNSVAGELRTTDTSVLAINRLSHFGFPLDNYDTGDQTIYAEAFNHLANRASASAQPLKSVIGNASASTYAATQAYPPLDDLYAGDRPGFNSAYSALGSRPANDLREIAKCIYGVSTGQPDVNARFFQATNGSYDTHAAQGGVNGQHGRLLADVASASSLFFEDMNDMGLGDKVTMVVYSEFSRRIPQNGGSGTDHGTQGPMFVIGEAVNGGMYGNHPDIDPAALDTGSNTIYSQDGGNPTRSTDFRDVFGTILKHWVNMPEAQILSDVLPLDVGPANDYWTTQDFDLGFL
jgi:uncharacterized protein (DUF1501 family)